MAKIRPRHVLSPTEVEALRAMVGAGALEEDPQEEPDDVDGLVRSYEAGMSLPQLAADSGLSVSKVRARLVQSGVEIRSSGGDYRSRLYEHNGEALTLTQWAARAAIKRTTLVARLSCGWSIERALTTPVKEVG